jgi:hypothetical protein
VKKAIAVSSCVAIVAVALTGCSTTPGRQHVHTTAPVTTGQTNDRVYGTADLAALLGSVNTSLGLGGHVSSKNGASTDTLNAIDVLLRLPGASITPAACTQFETSDGRNLLAFPGPDAVSAELTSSQLNLIAISPSRTRLPAGFASAFKPAAESTLETCETVHSKNVASAGNQSITITTHAVHTNVGTPASVGFTESAVVLGSGATTSSWTTIEAIDGNLELFVTGVSDEDPGSLEQALATAISAAQQ